MEGFNRSEQLRGKNGEIISTDFELESGRRDAIFNARVFPFIGVGHLVETKTLDRSILPIRSTELPCLSSFCISSKV
jgi:hypothetical protein